MKILIVEDTCDGVACYFASRLDLPGCHAQGWTPEEALSNLREAAEEYLVALHTLEWEGWRHESVA